MTTPSFNPDEILAQAPWIRKVVRSMLADEHLADDLAQETLEAGLRQGSSIHGSTRSWLYGVAKNLHRQFLRGQKRREVRERRVATPEFQPDSQDLVEKVEIMQIVENAVLALPTAPRDLLILRYYEELSVPQMAKLQGITVQAMESRLHRAKNLLRTQLQHRFGQNWIAAVLPLAGNLPASGLTVSPVSLLLMSKFTKVAALLIMALIFTAVFWPEPADSTLMSNGSNSEASANALAANEAGDADLGGSSLTPESENTAVANSTRTALRSGLTMKIVDQAGLGVANAQIQAYRESDLKRLGTIFASPKYFSYSPDLVATTLSDQEGLAHFPELTPDFQGVLYVRADDYIWRGFPVIPAEAHQESPATGYTSSIARDLGDLIVEGNAGHQTYRFLSPDFQPVSGLRLNFSANQTASMPGNLGLQSLITDEKGIVSFDSLPFCTGDFYSVAKNFIPWQVWDEKPNATAQAPVDVILDPGGSIAIQVVDSFQAPVKGAAIYSFNGSRTKNAPGLHEQLRQFKGHTNADGEFLLRGVQAKEGRDRVVALSGEAWAEQGELKDGDSITLQLPELHEITGRFVLASGTPAKGARLSLIEVTRPLNPPDFIQELDVNGRFVAHLPTGEYGLEVIHPQGSMQEPSPFILKSNMDLGKRTLSPGPELTLTLVDSEDGTPIQAPTVRLNSAQGKTSWAGPDLWKAVLARSSHASAGLKVEGNQIRSHHLYPGIHELVLRAPGYSSQVAAIELFADRPTEQTIKMHASASLQLTVLNAGGKAPAGTTIELVPPGYDPYWFNKEDGQRPKVSTSNGRTNREGLATFANLIPGVWKIGLWPSASGGLTFAEVELKKGSNQYEVVLPAESEVRVEVLAGGTPVQGAKVSLTPELLDKPGEFRGGGKSITTDANGSALFQRMQVGLYQVQVYAEDFMPLQENLEISGPNPLLTFHFKGTTVSGQVFGGSTETEVILFQSFPQENDESGDKRDLQRMFATDSASSYVAYGKHYRFGHQRVAANGQFSFRGVAPGSYSILAQSPGSLTCKAIKIEVPEAGLGDLEITLKPAATILVEISGMPDFHQAFPLARLAYVAKFEGKGTRVTSSTNRNGEITLQQIPIGAIELVFDLFLEESPTDPNFVWPVSKLEVQTTPGQTLRVKFDARTLIPKGD
jgi:RNA polymerase sigma-70 factor, ECF subfamily